MRETKRLLVVFALAFGLLAAACSSSAQTPATTEATASVTDAVQTTTTTAAPTTTEAPVEPTEIRYFTFSAAPDHLNDLNEMITRFEEANPDVKVNVETASFDDYFTSLQTQIAGADAPDAFELNFENFVSFASKGALADLTPFIGADAGFDANSYYKEAYDAFSLDGTQFGLPESYSTVLLFYNKELFDKAGLDYPTDAWKWADEKAAAKTISELGDNVWGFYAGIHYWEFYKTAAQNGCSLFTDGQVTINQPACVEALDYMLSYPQEGIQPTDAEMGGVSDGDMFLQGQIGLLTTGIWMFSSFADAPFGWDVVVEPGNTQKASHFFANGVALSASSDKKEAAYRWIRFFTSDPQAAKIRVDAAWELPTLTDQSLYDSYLAQSPPDNRAAVLKSLEHIVVPPVIERQSEMQDTINALLDKAKLGELTPQEALDQAKVEIEKLLG